MADCTALPGGKRLHSQTNPIGKYGNKTLAIVYHGNPNMTRDFIWKRSVSYDFETLTHEMSSTEPPS